MQNSTYRNAVSGHSWAHNCSASWQTTCWIFSSIAHFVGPWSRDNFATRDKFLTLYNRKRLVMRWGEKWQGRYGHTVAVCDEFNAFPVNFDRGMCRKGRGNGGGGLYNWLSHQILQQFTPTGSRYTVYCSTNLRIPIPHIAAFTSNID